MINCSNKECWYNSNCSCDLESISIDKTGHCMTYEDSEEIYIKYEIIISK